MSLNKVMLIGRLGKDPEVKTVGQTQVANFTVATSEKYTKDGVQQEKTEWSAVQAWGKLAEIAGKYLKKGSQVYVEGKLSTRSYDDKQGVKKYVTEIVANTVQFLDSKPQTQAGAPTPSAGESAAGMTARVQATFADSDIPF